MNYSLKAFLFLFSCLAVPSALAQYQPGQILYFKYCNERTEGRVLSQDGSGIRIEAKNPLTGQYDGSNIRYITPDIILPDAQPASAGGPIQSVTPAGNSAPNAMAQEASTPSDSNSPETALSPVSSSGGLLTKEEILGFLRQRLGTGDPFAGGKHDPVMTELAELIKARGVNFRMDIGDQYYKQLQKFGPSPTVNATIMDNFGSPAKTNFYFGTWKMFQSGGTTTFVKDNTLYRRMEYAGNSGSLTINSNGTYIWHAASGNFNGRWRNATKAEMDVSYKGGQGIVLLHGKAGDDWIVHDDDTADGQNIRVAGLTTRGTKEVGSR
ncbi:MAG: hypothetical protein K2Z81_26550 [Cyanobacteria bacterium]|nr:hypothetical protein [Cyanobacteriota bacterium]